MIITIPDPLVLAAQAALVFGISFLVSSCFLHLMIHKLTDYDEDEEDEEETDEEETMKFAHGRGKLQAVAVDKPFRDLDTGQPRQARRLVATSMSSGRGRESGPRAGQTKRISFADIFDSPNPASKSYDCDTDATISHVYLHAAVGATENTTRTTETKTTSVCARDSDIHVTERKHRSIDGTDFSLDRGDIPMSSDNETNCENKALGNQIAIHSAAEEQTHFSEHAHQQTQRQQATLPAASNVKCHQQHSKHVSKQNGARKWSSMSSLEVTIEEDDAACERQAKHYERHAKQVALHSKVYLSTQHQRKNAVLTTIVTKMRSMQALYEGERIKLEKNYIEEKVEEISNDPEVPGTIPRGGEKLLKVERSLSS